VGASGAAHAQTPPTITSNDYNIEIYQGPLIAPIHVMGVGGAYVALAEGMEGAAVNSAAPAVRDPYSTNWFDYDVSAGVSFPGAFTNSDFDNHGDANLPGQHASAGNFLDVNLGGKLQFGGLGVSLTGDLQQYTLTTTAQGTPNLTLQIGRWKALAAYGMLGGQLAVGGGVRVVTMQVLQSGTGTILTMTGAAPEAGALLMPNGQSWRIGATVRAPVSAAPGVAFLGTQLIPGSQQTAGTVGDFFRPSQVVMPWEAEVGIAYQLGPRPLNPGWDNPRAEEAPLRDLIEQHRAERQQQREQELAAIPAGAAREARRAELAAEERSLRAIEDDHLAEESERLRRARKARYANWPREKILLLASVLFTGKSPNAVSIEGFIDKSVESVGRSITLTPRLGLEGEPIQNRLQLRTGLYVEPSRYGAGAARQHVTFGSDIHLFPLDFWGLLPEADWKLGLFVDLAPRYTNWGLALGNWH
jgi:hypothetical protein